MSKRYRRFKEFRKACNPSYKMAWGIKPGQSSKPTMRMYRQAIHVAEKNWKHTGRFDIAPYHTSRLARKKRLSGTGWVRYINGFWDYLNSGVVVGHVMFWGGAWEAYKLAPAIPDKFFFDNFFRRCKTRAEAMRFVEGKE